MTVGILPNGGDINLSRNVQKLARRVFKRLPGHSIDLQ
jgi:hypothetical protein